MFSGAVTGDFNDVDVLQQGSNNSVGSGYWSADGLNIYGSHNSALIKQLGSGDAADVYQLGSHNTSVTIQQ
ncbi:MAG: hypothetical protein U5L09_12610 [Bacteroidales bacterium]|nr:hypothetical protein [Bacteroidales bacterium]